MLVVCAAYLMTTPDKPVQAQRESISQQLQTLRQIYTDRRFWRFAPQGCLAVGGFMAIQGLWAVPWLMQVNGLSR